MDGRKTNNRNPSREYIEYICSLYGDIYDDRIEDSSIGGNDWTPGEKAEHTSLASFRKYLMSEYNINMSTAKIRKILITGGYWTTERSRRVMLEYTKYGSIQKVADVLGLSPELVTIYMPYEKVVYDLVDKSSNAKRIERWRDKHLNTRVR